MVSIAQFELHGYSVRSTREFAVTSFLISLCEQACLWVLAGNRHIPPNSMVPSPSQSKASLQWFQMFVECKQSSPREMVRLKHQGALRGPLKSGRVEWRKETWEIHIQQRLSGSSVCEILPWLPERQLWGGASCDLASFIQMTFDSRVLTHRRALLNGVCFTLDSHYPQSPENLKQQLAPALVGWKGAWRHGKLRSEQQWTRKLRTLSGDLGSCMGAAGLPFVECSLPEIN